MPNYNDDTRIGNIILNEAPDSNDAKRTVNSVCLTIMGAQQFSMVAILPSCRKADLPETRYNITKTKSFMRTEMNFALGRMEAICSIVKVVGQLVRSGSE